MRLYMKYVSMHIKSVMQYKSTFLLMMLGQVVMSFTTLLGVWFMFDRVNQVEGFTLPQVMLCFASMLMSFSLAECFARGFDTFPRMISNGMFDRVLVRPRGPVFQVLASQVEFTRLGRMLQAMAVLAYALPTSGVMWTPLRLWVLAMMIVCGAVLFFCLFLIYAALSFFTLEGLEFMNVFTDGGREFGRYPFSIYGRDALRVFTLVVPLALAQYWPLLYLLGRSDSVWHMLSPLFSLWFALPAWGLWLLGLRHYRSTGS